nr:hypothetical protein [Neisseria mucosa]
MLAQILDHTLQLGDAALRHDRLPVTRSNTARYVASSKPSSF